MTAVMGGQGFNAGDRVPLAEGTIVTLMHASGDIVTLKGITGGVSLPKRTASAPDADRMAVLKFILARAPNESAPRAMHTLLEQVRWRPRRRRSGGVI